jgi:GDP-L-fucose synthase
MREFLHVQDLAEAVRFIMDYEGKLKYDLINAGTGEDLTIKALAKTIQNVVGHKGDIDWDTTKPDGTPRKLMEMSRMSELGWDSSIDLKSGVKDTYKWYLENIDTIKKVEIN